MAVVRAENVSKRYGETAALDGVSLTVSAGEIVGLVGPNGAGKTTLVRGVTGTTRVEGTVEVFGRPPRETDRSRLGLLPQSFAPASRLTARELVRYYGGLYDESRDATAVLRDVGLTDAADAAYETLSGGQQRRLCLGTALVNDPDLLVVDEPTTGIDPAGRRAVWRVIERLADDGTAVLLTSHSMTEVERLADRVGLLRDGRLVAEGSPAALIATHAGPARLTLEVSDAAARERAVGRLADAGYDARLTREAVVVRGVEPTEIGEVVARLPDTCEAVRWREPGLEDAYLALTGERFDDAALGRERPAESETDRRDPSEEVDA
ncbi:MAG: ABC transporter ATP-binding protein [Halobaculum sp.]